MARQWWQFSNWPDDPEPNAVEIWAPDTLPKPCTIIRQEWLNQFVAWKYYLMHDGPPDSNTWWLRAYGDGTPPSWNNVVAVGHNQYGTQFGSCGLQTRGFWEWVSTLEVNGSGFSPNLHRVPLPSYPANENAYIDNGGRGFSAGSAFAAYKYQDRYDRWFLDLQKPPEAFEHNGYTQVTRNPTIQKPWELVLNLHQHLTAPNPTTDYNTLKQYYLWLLRYRFDSMSVMFDNQAPLVEIGDLYGWWYGSNGSWAPHTHSQVPTFPFPHYRDPNTGEYVRDTHPYANSDGGVYSNYLMNGVGCGWNGGNDRSATNCIVRQIDACWLTDTNYRYALISMEDKYDTERFKNPPASIPLPNQYGYCHATFELPTYINLNAPDSVIVNLHGGGIAGSGWIGTPDPEADDDDHHNAIYATQSIRLVSYPYDIIPDAYKGPDWPTVSEEDEHGVAIEVPYLSNDRHNRWLDNQAQ